MSVGSTLSIVSAFNKANGGCEGTSQSSLRAHHNFFSLPNIVAPVLHSSELQYSSTRTEERTDVLRSVLSSILGLSVP